MRRASMTPNFCPARRWAATLVAVALTAAGCSSGDDSSLAVAASAEPTNAPAATDDDAVAADPTAPPVTTNPETTSADQAVSLAGADVFDPTVVHEISVTFDEADYDALLEAYSATGDKEWMQVTVTIDGATYEDTGMRLKGNSSLMALGRDSNAESAAGSPETLPWLIRLDRNVDGQTHHGYSDIVIRSNNTETSLNEAVALALLDEAGLASQAAAPASVSMNNSDPVLRLIVEHPGDDAWQDASFEADGALFKAEASGDWSYRGDDPDAYTDVFDQEGGDDLTDLTPLIEFLDFLNNSDDDTFAAELSEYLDVDAFATYLAMMDLIENTDDIDGPGNNSYLWWDAASGRFTVVPWDMNLAFGGFGMGPGGGFPGGGRGEFPAGTAPEAFPDGTLPDGAIPGGTPPEGGFPGGAGGMRGGRSNPLVERFQANEEFAALYRQRLTELRAELFESGTAETILQNWVNTLSTHATHLVSADTITAEAETIRSLLSD